MDMEDQSKIIGAAKRVYALFGERNINAILNMLSQKKRLFYIQAVTPECTLQICFQN